MAKRLVLIAVILFLSIGIDQISKVVATNTLQGTGRHSYLADTFRLEYAENHGAFLSLGSKLSDEARFIVLTVVVGLILLGVTLYTLFSHNLTTIMTVSLSLIIAGGISNLYDRIVNEGAVVDFLNMGISSLRTGIFNIADVYIMVGVGFIFIFSHKDKIGKTSEE